MDILKWIIWSENEQNDKAGLVTFNLVFNLVFRRAVSHVALRLQPITE